MKLMKLLFMAVIVFITTANSYATEEVELLWAETDGVGAYGYIEVKNIAFEKNVTIVYSAASEPGIWKEATAQYDRPGFADKEIWSFSTGYISNKYQEVVQFAIKYEVAGQTYWDNNNDQDYYFHIHESYFEGNHWTLLGKPNVKLHKLFGTTYLSGWVVTKDISGDKKIEIVYTTDNWETTKVLECTSSIASANQGQTYWKFEDQTNLPTNVTLEYAIAYTVNGITYWDNNFGENYKKDL